MKNVWILNHYAQEPSAGGGTRHFDLACHLTEYGWRASIIAAGIEHNTGRQRLLSGEKSRLASFGDVQFLWLQTPGYAGNGSQRLRNMLAYSARALSPDVARKLPKPEAIIGSSVHPFAAAAGALLARRFAVPFLFEVRDLWPETLISMGRLSERHPASVALRELEKRLYRRAKKIIVLLPHAYEYIRRFDIPEEKIVWIPNGVSLTRFGRPTPKPKGEEFVLMYFGAHGIANGIDNMIEAMGMLRSAMANDVKLRLIGDGPSKSASLALSRRLGLDNVSFEDPIPKDRIPALAAEADAFIFNLVDSPVFKYGVSANKLFDFMASGRPILFCCSSTNNPVEEAGAGLSISPGNPEELAKGIIQLRDAALPYRTEMGERARCYVEQNHDFRLLARRLADTLDSACAPG